MLLNVINLYYRNYSSIRKKPKLLSLTTYLCRFFLKELHLSILKKREEARDDVFQEGGVLRRRCHILKPTTHFMSRSKSVYPAVMFQCCANFSLLLQAYSTTSKTYSIFHRFSYNSKNVQRITLLWNV